jgi:hypothetical protein
MPTTERATKRRTLTSRAMVAGRELERFDLSSKKRRRASVSLPPLMHAFAMRCLLRPVSANRHAAPSSGMLAAIHEKQCAGRPFTYLHLRKVVVANEISHSSCDRKEQCVRRPPPPLLAPNKARERFVPMRVPFGFTPARRTARRDLPKFLVPYQYAIERFEFLERFRLERLTHVGMDKPAEPLPQLSRLRCNRVELPRQRRLAQCGQNLRGDQPSRLQPTNKVISRADPFNLRIDGHRNRIQEIQADRIGDEDRRREACNHGLHFFVWSREVTI